MFIQNFQGVFLVLQFFGFRVYRRIFLDLFVETFRWTKTPETPNETICKVRNLQNAITFRFLIFWELYFLWTLEIFWTKGLCRKNFNFWKVGYGIFSIFLGNSSEVFAKSLRNSETMLNLPRTLRKNCISQSGSASWLA